MKKFLAPIVFGSMFTGCQSIYHDFHMADVHAMDNIRRSSYQAVANLAKNLQKNLDAGLKEEIAVEQAKETVLFALKDPDSAKFRKITMQDFSGGKVVCGYVNSKNSYGGYNGFTKFAANTTDVIFSDEGNSLSNAGINAACP
ncbi:MAG: hypothetical protein ACTTJV_07010 [Ottowia sp.]